MDDCGDNEILPGITRDDTTSYEFRSMLANKLDEHSHSWDRDKGYWKFTGLQLDYFDFILCPLMYQEIEPLEDIYEKAYSPNHLVLGDPVFNQIISINTHYASSGRRGSIFMVMGKQQGTCIKLNFDIGIGQFVPLPVFNNTGDVYVRELADRRACGDSQVTNSIYDGNDKKWNTEVAPVMKKYKDPEWPVVKLDESLPTDLACVTSLDVFQRLLLIMDLCKNIDFYLWLNNITDLWSLWSEVCCAPMTLRHYKFLGKLAKQDANDAISLQDMLNKCDLLEYYGTFFRHNVYLGVHEDVLSNALPFCSFVGNGVFTLAEELR